MTVVCSGFWVLAKEFGCFWSSCKYLSSRQLELLPTPAPPQRFSQCFHRRWAKEEEFLGGISGDPEIIEYSRCGVWAENTKAPSSLNPTCPCLRFLAHTTLSAKNTNKEVTDKRAIWHILSSTYYKNNAYHISIYWIIMKIIFGSTFILNQSIDTE